MNSPAVVERTETSRFGEQSRAGGFRLSARCRSGGYEQRDALLIHAATEKVLANWGLPFQMTDYVGCARAAAVGIPAAQMDLFVERFVGHVINVQCGTEGR